MAGEQVRMEQGASHEPDTDYDGIDDGQEVLVDGTEPLNPDDGRPVQLGHWRFDDVTCVGERHQIPLAADQVPSVPSWSGNAVRIESPLARLSYRAVEADALANINCRRGTVRFWFKPSWESYTGPGHWARLIEIGNRSAPAEGWWALSVNPAGTQLVFESQLNAVHVTHLTASINWTAGQWVSIALTYDPSETRLYIWGYLVSSGSGIQVYPVAAARQAYGFTIGNNRSGSEQANGVFEEVETFNYPLSDAIVFDDCLSVYSLDADNDALGDVLENEWQTDPSNPDTDGDGLPDGDEVYTRHTNPLEADTDYDGRTDGAEVLADHTDPLDPTSVLPTNLARFTFDRADWAGERGQLPRQALSLTPTMSWSGTALKVDHAPVANLQYAEIETDASPNFNGRQGSVRFWFKPNWTSTCMGGSGPGQVGRFLEIGNPQDLVGGWWALSIDPTGNEILLETRLDGVYLEHFRAPVGWAAGDWHQVTLRYRTYDGSDVWLYVDGQYVESIGYQVAIPGASARMGAGLSIGSNREGGEQARGEFDEFETFNYPLSETEITSSYQARVAMPLNQHTVRVPQWINSSTALVEVNGAPASSMAVLVNNANFETATWMPLSSFTLEGLTGANDVWVGFRDQADEVVWSRHQIVVDMAPPTITITDPPVVNPEGTVTALPMIQLQGFTAESLSSLTFCLTNALGTNTDVQGFVLRRYYDSTVDEFTTSWFQCFDIDLAPGANDIFVRAMDLAGNETISKFTYVLDFSGVTTGPNILRLWPADGTVLSGAQFTLRGVTDDPTATIHATVAANGQTSEADGIVERNGQFWVEDLPLLAGNNQVTLTAQNAAGLVTTRTLALQRSSVQISLEAMDPSVFTNFTVTVGGSISDLSYSVWVNGVKAGAHIGGDWQAFDVPVNEGGVATLHVVAIPNDDHEGNGTPPPPNTPLDNVTAPNPTSPNAVAMAPVDVEKPAFVRVFDYHGSSSEQDLWDPCAAGCYADTEASTVSWVNGVGGQEEVTADRTYCLDPQVHGGHQVRWDAKGVASWRDRLPDGTWGEWSIVGSGATPLPDHPWEHCRVSEASQLLPDMLDLYARSGDTRIQLHTGGRSLAKQMNLFTITGGAAEVLDKRLPRNLEAQFARQIPPQDIEIPALGRLAHDALLYVVLRDGLIQDVTPRVQGVNFYRFYVGATKHRLHIIANETPLAPDRVRSGASFCVGQKVYFRYQFAPEVPRIKATTALWSLPPKFVNDTWQAYQPCGKNCMKPYGSKHYGVNPDLLLERSTSAWWVSPNGYVGGGTTTLRARLTLGLTSESGQFVSAPGSGMFTMYRPRLLGITSISIPPVQLLPMWDPPVLSVGDGTSLYVFQSRIESDWVGWMNYCQLVGFVYQWDGANGGTETSKGNFWLDNQEVHNDRKIRHFGQYLGPDSQVVNTDPPLPYDDGPELQCGRTKALFRLEFKTYVQFQPWAGAVAGNIPITLGRIEWNVYAEANKVGGAWILSPSSNVSTPSVDPNDDAFPNWQYVFTND